ncbi:hypothetical protein COX58_01645 [archaeon CG_4_10_14_0_2_um_filter_Archaea_38_6]|nr:MAG: hypothetical protein COX58_01645 [archaeon CG_4_10_14_0_2_um_filter_Archaea_38_6]
MKDELAREWENAGGDARVLNDKSTAHLMINENKILSTNAVKGIIVKTKELRNGASIDLRVKENARIKNPVHLCFGILEKNKKQFIKINLVLEKNSSAVLLAHCIFPEGKNIVHEMIADIKLGENSRFEYSENHFHGYEVKNVFVNPVARIRAGKNATYINKFNLLKGGAGRIVFDYKVVCADGASADMTAKVNSYKGDEVNIREKVLLEGADSNALLNTRIVLNDDAKGDVYNEIIGAGENSRGHVDCVEVINGEKAVAKAVPVVTVKNNTSKITHEAAIGRIDKASLNTLMSRGLTEKEAIEVIIKGLLK